MPIRRDERWRYPDPPLWRRIREAVLERARHRCEGSPDYPECRAEHGKPHPVTGAVVVLTVAHMDHNPENNTKENLRALCQRCHLKHDEEQRMNNRRKTLDDKRGQLGLPWNTKPNP